MTTFNQAIPKLATTNIAAAIAFYETQLGFTKQFQMDDYAGLERDHVEIHLWGCEDRSIAENTGCRISVTQIETLYADYQLKGVIHPNHPLGIRPWGMQEFSIIDPDGNCITFFELIDEEPEAAYQ
ncbi:MAG: VOC family protein [Thermosynechococcaceae cyanobacterium MS004]|nr:VOC family protein [Thermosynechococcaceae cyanobacterium MS004]